MLRCDDMAVQSVLFCNFKLLNAISIEDISNILSSQSKVNEDFFVLNEVGNYFLDGYYIAFYITKEVSFNNLTNEFISSDVKKSTVIPFTIDIERMSLDVWGSRSNASKVISALAVLLNNDVIIDIIDLSLPDIIQRMKKVNIIIGKVKVDNIVFENDLVASCTFDLSNHVDPYSIVSKYNKEIVQLSGILDDGTGDTVRFTIYNTGTVVFYKAKEQLSASLVSQVKKLCLE